MNTRPGSGTAVVEPFVSTDVVTACGAELLGAPTPVQGDAVSLVPGVLPWEERRGSEIAMPRATVSCVTVPPEECGAVEHGSEEAMNGQSRVKLSEVK